MPQACGHQAFIISFACAAPDVMIAAGTCIDISPRALHHSKAAWGEDAKQWRPTRWLEGRSANAVKRMPSGALRWIPFSDGRQNCICQRLAIVRSKLHMHTLAMQPSRRGCIVLVTKSLRHHAGICS